MPVCLYACLSIFLSVIIIIVIICLGVYLSVSLNGMQTVEKEFVANDRSVCNVCVSCRLYLRV